MKRAERRLIEEDERAKLLLDPSTEPKLREVAERELIARHMRTLAEMEQSGLISMLNDDRRADLTRMYSLFKRIVAPTPGLAVMRDLLSTHVREQGKALINAAQLADGDAAGAGAAAAGAAASAAGGSAGGGGGGARDPVSFVEELLRLKERYDVVIEQAFLGDKLFVNMLNR